MTLLHVLLLGVVGWIGWRRVSPALRPMLRPETDARGVLLFLAGWVVAQLVAMAWVEEEMGLRDRLFLVGAANSLAVVLVLSLRRVAGGSAKLGFRAHDGPPAVFVAAFAWMAWLPLVFLMGVANVVLLEALDVEVVRQEVLQQFMSDPEAQGSPAVWGCAVILFPVCEEILYRGALHGGLRRLMPVPLAVVVSSLMFGAGHEPNVLLLSATLGVLLALVYERTGSLLAPILVHSLHNTVTLLMV